jgi:hydrogenase maturation protease
MTSVVVIGVGNPDRGDDAIGHEVAWRLAAGEAFGAKIVEVDGEATTILSHLENVSTAIIVDACRSGAPAGTVRRISLAEQSLPQARYGLSSHGFGLAEAVALAQALGKLPTTCIVYAVEAEGFERGAPLSAAAMRGVVEVVEALRREIAAL